MASYDVVDLFTNIPLEEALDILRKIFMPSFEEAALSTASFQALRWYRKVDDTFTTIANDNDPSELLNHLNDQHPRIKFTVETETNLHLPFLDVSIHTTDDGLRTSAYRHPMHTGQYIHYNYCHHPQIKHAIIATLTRRGKALCHPDALNSELDHLRKTFTTLVTATINKILKDREPRPKPSPSPIRATIPYLGPISHQISRLTKTKASIDVTFSSCKTIKTHLKANGKGPSCQHPNPRGCIYQIPCNCGDLYIGEPPGTPINTRMKEHQTSREQSFTEVGVLRLSKQWTASPRRKNCRRIASLKTEHLSQQLNEIQCANHVDLHLQ
ncbi:uncharacterized protein [Haliotis asinina]|uniref:uncharacterized protein n=1 Tax=Haliotis asinina TaxID=109174 RepID=UPI003531C9B0